MAFALSNPDFLWSDSYLWEARLRNFPFLRKSQLPRVLKYPRSQVSAAARNLRTLPQLSAPTWGPEKVVGGDALSFTGILQQTCSDEGFVFLGILRLSTGLCLP